MKTAQSFFLFSSYYIIGDKMKVYSHRGESKYAPENTMSAYYLAYLVGSDGIETDLRKTKDDVLVLIHDKSVDRTSNYSGKVADYTFEELLNMDFGDEYYKGEKIVRLTEFLKNFSERNVNVYIELKETGYEKLIVDTLKQYNLKNVVLISFKYNLLKKIREMDNSIKLGWLIYDVNDSIIKDCKNIKLNHVLCTAICLSKDEVTKLKNNNFIVSAWGVLGKSEIKRLKNIGVDRIIYDSGYDVKKFLKKERKNV